MFFVLYIKSVLSEFSDTMKALIKLYANRYGLAFFFFPFSLF